MTMLDYLGSRICHQEKYWTNDKWFKKIDKKYREKASYNKLEGKIMTNGILVRDLNDDEKSMKPQLLINL